MRGQQPPGHVRNSTKYKALRERFFEAQGPVGRCWLCGGPVDMSLSGRWRNGKSVDHAVPLSVDPSVFYDTSMWRLAHRACNSRRGVPMAPKSPNA